LLPWVRVTAFSFKSDMEPLDLEASSE
jgi:hypothetical protein